MSAPTLPSVPASVRQRVDQNSDWLRDFTRFAVARENALRVARGQAADTSGYRVMREGW